MQINKANIDETEKLRLIAKGNNKALQWLYKHSFGTTLKMVLRLGGSEDEAWDVFQDAVTVLYDQCQQADFSLQCKINTYITSIARNLWLKTKSKDLSVSMPDEWETPAEAALDLDFFLQQEAQYQQLHSSLNQLGDSCSKILKAFYFEKKSIQQITDELGYTNATNTKTQKFKCLARLKKIMNPEKD